MRQFNIAGPVVAAESLPHPAAVAARPPRVARPRARQEVLRLARAAADGQDVRVAGVARSAQRPRRLPLRVREHRERSGRARGRGGRRAHRACGSGVPGQHDAGRRRTRGSLAGRAGPGRSARRAPAGAGALVPGQSEAAGAAAGRDRHADRRHAAGRAAPAPHRLPGIAPGASRIP